MNVLGLIPARGGSKGVPRKNIRTLAGKPLIAWTLETARQCRGINRLLVSTDDAEIAAVAKQFGGDVPFLRPSALAQDDTPDFPVFQHAYEWLRDNAGYTADIVVWLRPTSPLRTSADIDGALSVLNAGGDCVRSVCAAEHHPYWMKRLDGDKMVPFVDGADETRYTRRQLLPPAYRLNGAVDVARCSESLKRGTLFGGDMRAYVMPSERSVDLDYEIDFKVTEMLLREEALK